MNPKFSIIIPTYNRAWCVERAIKSVLDQEFKDWELVIVDDGSTDNTRNVVGKYLSDSRIKYLRKKNGGVGSARNFGIERAVGEYYIFLDSDDAFYDENSLVKITKTVGRYSRCDYFGFGTIGANGKAMSFLSDGDAMEAGFEDVLKGVVSGEFLPCVKSAVFLDPENRFPEDINGGEGLLWWRLFMDTPGIFFSYPVRRYYFDAKNSITRTILDMGSVENNLKINDRVLEFIGERIKVSNPKKYGEIILIKARMLALLGRKVDGIRLVKNNISYIPFDLKRIALFSVALLDKKMHFTNILIKIFEKK